jgi:hypothetical protein
VRRAGNDDQRSKRRLPTNPLTVLTLRCPIPRRVYLAVSYWEKQECKRLGGCWHAAQSSWFVAPECFEAIAKWPTKPNPYAAVKVAREARDRLVPVHARQTYRLPRALSKPLTVDRFGNVLTDADLSA